MISNKMFLFLNEEKNRKNLSYSESQNLAVMYII